MPLIGHWDLKGHQFFNFFPYLVQCAIGENELTQNRSAVVLRFLNQQERPQRSHKGYRYNLLTSWYIAFQAQAFSLAKRPDSHFTFHCAATIVYDQRFLRRNWKKKQRFLLLLVATHRFSWKNSIKNLGNFFSDQTNKRFIYGKTLYFSYEPNYKSPISL